MKGFHIKQASEGLLTFLCIIGVCMCVLLLQQVGAGRIMFFWPTPMKSLPVIYSGCQKMVTAEGEKETVRAVVPGED